MARLRYVQDLSPAPGAAKPAATQTMHTVQSIRALYETEPEIAAAHAALVAVGILVR